MILNMPRRRGLVCPSRLNRILLGEVVVDLAGRNRMITQSYLTDLEHDKQNLRDYFQSEASRSTGGKRGFSQFLSFGRGSCPSYHSLAQEPQGDEAAITHGDARSTANPQKSCYDDQLREM